MTPEEEIKESEGIGCGPIGIKRMVEGIHCELVYVKHDGNRPHLEGPFLSDRGDIPLEMQDTALWRLTKGEQGSIKYKGCIVRWSTKYVGRDDEQTTDIWKPVGD